MQPQETTMDIVIDISAVPNFIYIDIQLMNFIVPFFLQQKVGVFHSTLDALMQSLCQSLHVKEKSSTLTKMRPLIYLSSRSSKGSVE